MFRFQWDVIYGAVCSNFVLSFCERRFSNQKKKEQQNPFHTIVDLTHFGWLAWEFLQSRKINSIFLFVSQEDLLIHGDSVYDIIDKQDHSSIQAELGRSMPQQTTGSGSHHHHHSTSSLDGEQRIFLCRMNVSRNARRQMRFGDQKVSKTKFTWQLKSIWKKLKLEFN